ncbi:MAG: hypothetical protein OEX12_00365 [Gammaproteobacteria bacterium]|nr:hypothetical protein [Gammaproteobacteria bacterium]
MGGGTYSVETATTRRAVSDYHTKSNDEIFQSRMVDPGMDPRAFTMRESRDSDEHPESFAICIGLDVTGSMGSVPQELVRDGLPRLMGRILQNGEPDPQILFMGIGDHECDEGPLQIGQFESDDEMIDKWLLATWLEGGGGGNMGESYLLAWYAALRTQIDCLEKRGRKGLLFTIGDEPCLPSIHNRRLGAIVGDPQLAKSDGFINANELLYQAREVYDIYHIHVLSTRAGQRFHRDPGWLEAMGDNLLTARNASDVIDVIAEVCVQNREKWIAQKDVGVESQQTEETPEIKEEDTPMFL